MSTALLPPDLLARTFIPDNLPATEALIRTTHLGVGAHQDDLEFMALHGILECFGSGEHWFGGITCTDGAGSARTEAYAGCSDAQMAATRQREQNTAAMIGGYSFMTQLGLPSTATKDVGAQQPLVDTLALLLRATTPQIVYTHNPADKHPTHIGVFAALLKAIRSLPKAQRPHRLIGCEVWRGLDWLCDEHKVRMNTDGHPNLAAALSGVFDSQISGGKRYDLAVQGRRRANATFLDSHAVDNARELIYGIDLTPLVQDEHLCVRSFVGDALATFTRAVDSALSAHF